MGRAAGKRVRRGGSQPYAPVTVTRRWPHGQISATAVDPAWRCWGARGGYYPCVLLFPCVPGSEPLGTPGG